MNTTSSIDTSVRSTSRGLEVDLAQFEEMRLLSGAKSLWDDRDNRDNLLFGADSQLGQFFAKFVGREDGVAIFERRVNGREVAASSVPVADRGLPESLKQEFELALEQFQARARENGVTEEAQEFIHSLRMADPKDCPELYRLYRVGRQQRLLVLWGCVRKGSLPLLPLDAIKKLPTNRGRRAPQLVHGLAALLAACALLMLAILLWPFLSGFITDSSPKIPIAEAEADCEKKISIITVRYEREIEKLRTDIADSVEANKRLETELAQLRLELELKNKQIATLQNQNDEHSAMLDEVQRELARARELLVVKDKDIVRLTEEKRVSEVKIRDLELALAAAEKEIRNKDKEIAARLKEVGDQKETIGKLQGELAALVKVMRDNDPDKKIKELAQTVAKQQEDIGKLQGELSASTKLIAAKEKEIAKLSERLSEEVKRNGVLQGKLDAATELLASRDKDIADLNRRVADLDRMIQDLRTQAERARKELADKDKLISSLQDRLASLEKPAALVSPPFFTVDRTAFTSDTRVTITFKTGGKFTCLGYDGSNVFTSERQGYAKDTFSFHEGYKSLQFAPTDKRYNGAREVVDIVVYYEPEPLPDQRIRIPIGKGINKLGLSIDWGDKTPVEKLDGADEKADHRYRDAGVYTAKVLPPQNMRWAEITLIVKVMAGGKPVIELTGLSRNNMFPNLGFESVGGNMWVWKSGGRSRRF